MTGAQTARLPARANALTCVDKIQLEFYLHKLDCCRNPANEPFALQSLHFLIEKLV